MKSQLPIVNCQLLIANLVAMLALTLGGCGPVAFQPLAIGEAPWRTGEVSTYAVFDRDGASVGTAQYDVLAGGAEVSDEGWTLRREIDAQNILEIAAVEVFGSSLRPAFSTLVRVRPDGQETARTVYSSGQVDIELSSTQEVYTAVQYDIPTDVRDQRTILMLVRALPLEQGYATRVNSYLPIANRLERVEIRVAGREEVTVPAGVFDTWRVVLNAQNSRVTAWIGVDPPHPIVKIIDDGSEGTFELTSFQPGE